MSALTEHLIRMYYLLINMLKVISIFKKCVCDCGQIQWILTEILQNLPHIEHLIISKCPSSRTVWYRHLPSNSTAVLDCRLFRKSWCHMSTTNVVSVLKPLNLKCLTAATFMVKNSYGEFACFMSCGATDELRGLFCCVFPMTVAEYVICSHEIPLKAL